LKFLAYRVGIFSILITILWYNHSERHACKGVSLSAITALSSSSRLSRPTAPAIAWQWFYSRSDIALR